jgi:DNA-binding response OmpR family regulator
MIYRFETYEIDEERHELHRSGEAIPIEPKVFQVLLYLLENRDHVVSKEELLEQCWPDAYVSESALTRCLTKLRKSVQADRTDALIIKTVPRLGYRFVAAVTTASQNPPPVSHGVQDDVHPAKTSKILIVDDNPSAVEILTERLEHLGYATVSAGNGQEALEKVAAESPDLILLDVMMPIMDGFTVCRILKEKEETRLIPIVIMTALDQVNERIQGIEAGADDFLTKPVNAKELLARIRTTLKLKHTVDRKIHELNNIKSHLAPLAPYITRSDDSPA